jgi:hypothetical protein
LLFLGVAVSIGYNIPHEQIPLMPVPTPAPQSKPAATKENDIKTAFQPPSEDKVPDNEFGQMVKLGADIFHDTQRNAKEFVGEFTSMREVPDRQRAACQFGSAVGGLRGLPGVSRQRQPRKYFPGTDASASA